MELVGHVMNYEWGKKGLESIVAQLARLNDQNFCLNPEATYAELWMGDHKSGPAKVKSSGLEISNVIQNKLPFLLKVLSIQKALSIQVHPNKEEAQRLHAERPDIYKDPNHKPELAIALTPFVALCGFRPSKEIYEICFSIKPLKNLIGEANLDLLKREAPESIKNAFKQINYTPKDSVKSCLLEIANDYESDLRKYGIYEVFQELNKEFPEDIGILALFFLNLIHLAPGQSIYLGANVIHAYLSGDCIECMACSDNVIRAGLTPKYRDVEQLLASLNYAGASAEANIFKPIQSDQYKSIYAPPVEDFAVVRLKLPSNAGEYSMDYKPTDSILIVVHGSGYIKFPNQSSKISLKRGDVYYIPSSAAPNLIFKALNEENEPRDFDVYIASGNVFMDLKTSS